MRVHFFVSITHQCMGTIPDSVLYIYHKAFAALPMRVHGCILRWVHLFKLTKLLKEKLNWMVIVGMQDISVYDELLLPPKAWRILLLTCIALYKISNCEAILYFHSLYNNPPFI